ncbi:endonuclease/exonuclease/phosphatase family protein [Croceivirga sp. JEA036]|uniref:endonuclease/exonuclease/phosphatase family protein n=1 Tax=Croceivirga sp. JEA036 TaxID=2721162 RepID=UPI00143CA8A8|nr:hypothetical protein [Croceivirga sp. JEA036]NJB35873.1 hypothetical protein [Croceivirga sp. JEA036]
MATLKFALWNAEWMNELFTGNPPQFHPNNHKGYMTKQKIENRRRDLAGVINDIDADIWVLVEGPNQKEELQLFFDSDIQGDWQCEVQSSGAQSIGIAIKTDNNLFAANPITWHDLLNDPLAQPLRAATDDFFMDTDNDGLKEQHKFERRPLYATIHTANQKAFRVVGVHLKSKGIFNAMEWSKWWAKADGNRKKIVAQCYQLRCAFLDDYLEDATTKDIPIIICGDINDGPGFDTSEMKISASGVERLMGSIWQPEKTLGNVMFDSLSAEDQKELDFRSLYTASFKDPIFNNQYQRAWIDHILYSKNKKDWIANGAIIDTLSNGEKIYRAFPDSSDHFPVVCNIETTRL